MVGDRLRIRDNYSHETKYAITVLKYPVSNATTSLVKAV